MTDCEYQGWCRMECPPDQLDYNIYTWYQENPNIIEDAMNNHTYRTIGSKHRFRGEFLRKTRGAL